MYFYVICRINMFFSVVWIEKWLCWHTGAFEMHLVDHWGTPEVPMSRRQVPDVFCVFFWGGKRVAGPDWNVKLRCRCQIILDRWREMSQWYMRCHRSHMNYTTVYYIYYENMDCTAVHQETPPSFWGIFSNTFFNHFCRCRTQAFRAAAPIWPAWAMTRRCCAFGGGSVKPERGDLKCLIGMEPGLGWLALGVTWKMDFL